MVSIELFNASTAIDFIFSALAIVLNTLVLTASFRIGFFNSADILIITILAIIDLIYSLFSVIFNTILFVAKEQLLYDGSVLCWLDSIFNYIIILNNVTILSILAWVRYMCIVNKKKFKFWKVTLVVITSILINLILMIVDFSISTSKVMPIKNYCQPRKVVESIAADTYVKAFNIILILKFSFFITMIYFCYLNIMFYHYKKSSRALLDESCNANNLMYSNFNHHIRKNMLITILKAFLMLSSYTISVVPDIVTLIPYVINKTKVNPSVDLVCSFLRGLLPLFDALFVLILHEDMFKVVKGILLERKVVYNRL